MSATPIACFTSRRRIQEIGARKYRLFAFWCIRIKEKMSCRNHLNKQTHPPKSCPIFKEEGLVLGKKYGSGEIRYGGLSRRPLDLHSPLSLRSSLKSRRTSRDWHHLVFKKVISTEARPFSTQKEDAFLSKILRLGNTVP